MVGAVVCVERLVIALPTTGLNGRGGGFWSIRNLEGDG